MPNVDVIKHEQSKQSCPGNAKCDENAILKPKGRIWIRIESTALKDKVILSTNCGEQGNRTYETTLEIISESF